MDFLSGIKGGELSLRFLRGSLSKERIANGYLFTGPDRVAKRMVAEAFVRSALGIDVLPHPDCLCVAPEDSKNTSPERSRRIKIEQIRILSERMNLKPFSLKRKACIIEDAHMMTNEAANALLKLLEEPPADSFLVLIADRRELLPPTIVSRCVFVPFRGEAGTTAGGGADRKKEIISFLVSLSDEVGARPACPAGRPAVPLQQWDRERRDYLTDDLETILSILADAAAGRDIPGPLETARQLAVPSRCPFDGKEASELYDIAARVIELKTALDGNANPKLVAAVLPGILV